MNITKGLEGYGWVFESSIEALGPTISHRIAQASYSPGHEGRSVDLAHWLVG